MVIKNKNHDNLICLLKDNAKTVYGRQYDFENIDSFEEYQKKVPIADYPMLYDYIDRMRQGEKNVLTAYELSGFCKTSGSTGITKYIPITQKQLELFSNHTLRFSDERYKECGGKRLMMSCFRINYDDESVKTALLSDIYYQYAFKKGIRKFEDYAGAKTAMFNPSIENNMYIKAWLFLGEEDITIIDSIYMYDIFLLFRYIEENWNYILDEMECRAIPKSRHLSEEETRLLLENIPTENRKKKIEENCKKGFNNIAKKLWPRLQLIVGISSLSSQILEKNLNFYLGNISKNYLIYGASECMVGEANEENSYAYDLVMDTAVYEFRDIYNDGKIVLPEDLEIGKLYEPVISNYSGLYRYPMGDVIKCTQNTGDTIKMIFIGRKNHGINICGEKMSLDLLNNAILMLEDKGIKFLDYCFGKSNATAPSHYILWGCIKDMETSFSPQQIAIYLDQYFKKNNIDYKELRNDNSLQKPVCYLLDDKHYDNFKIENSLINGQSKPQHILWGSYEE